MYLALVVVGRLIFGAMGLIVLGEILSHIREARRRSRLTDEERAIEDSWAFGGGFKMRRDGSELRGRHEKKAVPRARTAQVNQLQKDPYAP